MARDIILFKSSEKKDRQSAAEFLHQLADRVAAGEVILKRGTEEFVLEIPSTVTFEIKAEDEPGKRRTKRSLEIELEWYPGEENGTLELG